MASAVATEEPQMAANSVHDTTVTRPRAPRMVPNQPMATSTSALATPPRRMNAAAMTKSGRAISVVELSSSTIFCAIEISGAPLTVNSTAAHTPSTRKIGMPAASRPKNSSRNRRTQHARPSVLLDGDHHGGRVEPEHVAV